MPKQKELLLGGFIEHAPMAIAMLDTNMRYLAASRRWYEDYGLDKSVIGRSHYDIFPEIPERWKEIHRIAMTGETLRSNQDLFVRGNGAKQWLRWEVQPWYDSQNELCGLIIFSEDITARVNAVEVLEESEERFRLAATITNDLIFDCDLESGRVWWNESLIQNFGYDPIVFGASLGIWTACIVPADQMRVVDGIRSLVGPGGSKWRDKYRIVRSDGRTAVVVDNRTVTRDQRGAAVRMLGNIRDVTESDDLDERLRQSQKLESVGQLTGGIAHDFNNMLTVITGTIDILSMGVADRPELAAIVKLIGDAADRGAELTSRLLAFSRQQPLRPRAVDVNKLTVEVANLLRPTLGEQIEVKLGLTGDSCAALVDPSQLGDALVNLAINARDAMPSGGKLTLETSNAVFDQDQTKFDDDIEAGSYVLITVSDTGTGIPEALLNKVFEPFFSTKDVGAGTGLGLSMVHGFVKQSGGHIRLYSEEGYGTTFKIYLPQADQTPLQIAELQHEEIEGGTETILAVEDDAAVREYVITQLQSLGYKTLIAANAVEALEIVDSRVPFDLLFTDVIMPGEMNGSQLAQEVARRRSSLRVLFTSGYSQNAISNHGRLDPDVLLLSKPYRRSDMARMLRLALGKNP